MAETICWSCAKACGKCPWSEHDRMRPVAGWTAKRRRTETGLVTYLVMLCPMYEWDGRTGADKARTRAEFTPEEDAALLEMRAAHMSYDEIAEKLGRSKSSLVTRTARLKRKGTK